MMSELRWILLLIGALVIAGVYAYTRYQRHVRNEASFGERRVARDLLESAAGEEMLVTDPGDVPDVGEAPTIGLDGDDAASRRLEELLIMHVRAAAAETWSGTAIVKAAEAAGLRRTDKDIFQYFSSAGHALFYVANMFKPGVFDWRRMDEFETRGLSLFMRLPTTCPATEALKAMLGCAGKLTEALGGDMLDAERRPLSEEALARMRTLCEAHDEAHEETHEETHEGAREKADEPRL